MIEEYLANYGVLGIWTLSLLAEKYLFQNKMKKVIENNTNALHNFKEIIQKCERRKK